MLHRLSLLALGVLLVGCQRASTPPEVEVVQIATGGSYTCALSAESQVRCWGPSALAYGNPESIDYDVVASGAGDVDVWGRVTQISTGYAHTCALLDTGRVRCWGDGRLGQLGYGNIDTIGDDEPPSYAGDVDVGGTVTQISAGGVHTCALLTTGRVRCWGYGYSGALGNERPENIGDDEAPSYARDVDVGGTVTQISAGGAHTCALLDTGRVRCWGEGGYGALGYGNVNTIGDYEPPSYAGDVDVGGTVTQISAGGRHTCALLTTGRVRCWGYGTDGRLGYGNVNTIGNYESPSYAGDVNVGGTVTHISAGGVHTCALLTTGRVRCWGAGAYGALGYGNTENIGDDEAPASAGDVDVGGTVTQVSAGNLTTCVLLDTGHVRCWGSGALGYGFGNPIGDDEAPSSVGDVDGYSLGDCPGGYVWLKGLCIADASTEGGFGASCDTNDECKLNICAKDSAGAGTCTGRCDLNSGDCPDGFGCLQVDDTNVCWAGVSEGGTGGARISPVDCPDGRVRLNGFCVADASTEGGFGASCDTNDECKLNICAKDSAGAGTCTGKCDLNKGDCPDGFGCLQVDDTNVCWAGVIEDTGGFGCAITSPGSGLVGMMLIFLGILFERRRRN